MSIRAFRVARSGTATWPARVRRKIAPGITLLVHDSDHSTYVAERNLEADTELQPIAHPMLAQFFSAFEQDRYRRLERDN